MRAIKLILLIGSVTFIGTQIGIAKQLLLHVRPTPELPVVVDIARAGDIFTYSLGRQIHCNLFEQGIENNPRSHLVDTFFVSKDQMTYEFRLLPNLVLHDSSKITSGTVKASLELSIKSRAVNFDSFSSIKGYSDFVNGKKKNLVGVKLGDSRSFKIILIRPDINLINKLTDIRFAIRSITEPLVGCGPYRVVSIKPGQEWVLEYFSGNSAVSTKTSEGSAPRKLIYQKSTYREAIDGFIAGRFHDLALFVPKGEDIERIKGNSKSSLVSFPRTYIVGLNPKVFSRRERELIFSKINRQDIIKSCYPDQTKTDSLIPPGFLGYDEGHPIKHQIVPPEKVNAGKTKVILIIDGVGSESCVEKTLQPMLRPLGLKVQIASIGEYTKNWHGGRIGGVFAYIEGETSFHYFGSFNPKVEFSWGSSDDKLFEAKLEKFLGSNNAETQSLAAKELSNHLLSLSTIVPFFHQKGTFYYDRKYRSLGQIFTSPALTPIVLFKSESDL